MNLSKLLFLSLLAGGVAATAFAQGNQPYVIDNEGRRIMGTDVRSGAGGQITLTLASGKTQSFAQGGFRKVYKPMPPAFKAAVQAFNAGQIDSALPQFEAIQKNNRYLNWDFHAGSYLVRCYLAQEKPDLASQVVGTMMAIPGAKENAIVIGTELDALIGGGKLDSANRKIESYVSGPNREVAAIAQCRRGDVFMGKDLYDQAVLEYLRTVVFFGDADSEILAEAKFKTGLALQKLKDSARSQMMFTRTKKEHPGSYWALRAADGK